MSLAWGSYVQVRDLEITQRNYTYLFNVCDNIAGALPQVCQHENEAVGPAYQITSDLTSVCCPARVL